MAYQYKLTWTDIPDDMVEEETYKQEHCINSCNCPMCQDSKDLKKVDRDYFQSVWDEYVQDSMNHLQEKSNEAFFGKVNFVQDASIPMPKGEDCILTTASGEYIPPTGTEALITEECENLKNLLIEKNRRYGDSAINRGQIYDIPATVAIKARINDKLLRLKNLQDDESEDVVLDLLGYFILLRIATKKEEKEMVDSYASMFPGK